MAENNRSYTNEPHIGSSAPMMLGGHGPGGRHEGPGGRYAEYEKADNIGETLIRLVKYFMKERGLFILLIVVVAFGALCAIYAPSQQSNAIDVITGTLDMPLARCVIAMITAYLLYCLCQFLQSICTAHLSNRIVKRMRSELFDKIIDLPIKYMDTHSHGDVMSRMTNDIENISNIMSRSLPSLISGVLTVIGTAAVMLWYYWPLALLSFATVILSFIATIILSKYVRKYSRQRQALLGELNGTAEEMISGYHTVVAYNHQEKTTEEFFKTADEMTKAGIRADSIAGVTGPINNCISNISFVIITAFGGYFALNGWISIGVISAFIIYAKQFSRPINEISQIYGQLQTAIAGAERVFHVMDEVNEDMSGETAEESDTADISFENINFSYEEGHEVIHDFSLKVPSGKKVALVGATGSGKTTIVNLLMRFYDPDSGRICINGKDITELARPELRRQISIVLQDTVMFTDTIMNNLKYANEDMTEEQLDRAIRMSKCDDMLSGLPDGINTVLAQGGSNISQGQRQLLAIARAFVADPKILILDEATSNVDTRTEKAIQDAMHVIMQNRTSIIIAHRLSTIRDADLIIVMDDGRIVESGTHEELLAKRGRYYDLYMIQFAGIAT